MTEALVNGIQLYYEEHGEGAPIACIHGMGSSALMWGEAVDELARLGRVIVYDRRGHTRSERPDPYERTSVAEHAEDAAGMLDSLGAAPAVVIGRSSGGAVALELALRHPERVRALVLLEADAFGLSATAAEWWDAAGERMRSVAEEDGVEAVPKALIDEMLGEDAWASFPEEVRQMFSQNGQALLAEFSFEKVPADPAALAGVDMPVLLVVAAESPPEQREMTEALADALPNARLERIGGGHLIDPAGPAVLVFIEEMLESPGPR